MPFQLGQRSLANLDGVHPQLVKVVRRAIELSAVDFGVPERAVRTAAEQAEKVRRGVSKTLNSRHLIRSDGFGHAVDLVPWIERRFTWNAWDPFFQIAAAMRDAANTAGVDLVWGGVWDKGLAHLPGTAAGLREAVEEYKARHPGPDFLDGPHFELD